MSTVPQMVLAGMLIAGGAATGVFLLNKTKQLPPPQPPAPKPFTCQMGQLLIYPNCYQVKEGNVDFNLNIGNRFSTFNSEYAHLIVVTGTIRINDIHGPRVTYFRAGDRTDIGPAQIVTATSDNTLLHKRAW